MSNAEVDEEVLCQESEIRRRIERYRGGRVLPSLKGQTVILVDDGIATGRRSMRRWAPCSRRKQRRSLPRCGPPPRVLAELKMLVDDMVVLHTSEWFFGMSQFYEQFPQVKDEEVIACLEEVRRTLTRERKRLHEDSAPSMVPVTLSGL